MTQLGRDATRTFGSAEKLRLERAFNLRFASAWRAFKTPVRSLVETRREVKFDFSLALQFLLALLFPRPFLWSRVAPVSPRLSQPRAETERRD